MWPLKLLLFVLYTITAVFTITGLLLVAPYIETKYFPVVDKLHIDRLEHDGTDQTIVYASFEKLRDCDYVGIAWYHGSRSGGFVRAPLQILRSEKDISSPNRPLGRQDTGPWIVGIPLDEVRANSFVELYHHCTPLWITTTEFYP